tara:strand:- start:92 stop:331 length:240 start_codon:yes stop_codon:yes gene_type:complete
MTIYQITVGNIYNDDDETVIGDCWDQAEYKAEEAAIKMLADIQKEYKDSETYYTQRMTVQDDITFKREEIDAYEYSQDY